MAPTYRRTVGTSHQDQRVTDMYIGESRNDLAQCPHITIIIKEVTREVVAAITATWLWWVHEGEAPIAS